MNTAFLQKTKAAKAAFKRAKAFVTARYDLTDRELVSRARPSCIVWARWVAFTFMRQEGVALERIGGFFGKDHGTVLYGPVRLQEVVQFDQRAAADWSEAKAEFGATTPSTSRPG